MTGLRRFQGKCVVVTGASSAIGAATALAFAREGAHLALVAHRRAHLALMALELRGAGGEGLFFPMDASDVSELPRTLDDVFARLGAVDIVVNAGGMRGEPRADAAAPERARRLELTIPFALTCVALARIAAHHAAIITVGPAAARVSFGGATLYFVRTDARAEAVAASILRCAADGYGV
jgi:NADP-dependent 3-hydroxy acid dehydrogenase YdfG